MEKTLSLGAFEELSENEVMVTEGGLNVLLGACIYETIKAVQANIAAQRTYNICRNDLIQTIKDNPECVSSVPTSALDYFNIHVDGGYNGIQGGIH